MQTCLSESQGIGKLDTFRFVLHIVSSIEIPIFFLGAYCILFKTPAKMNSVKWMMFCLHFFGGLTDFCLSFVIVPVLFLPAMAGVGLGPLDYPKIFLGVIAYGLAAVTITILTIFENRYYVLFGRHTCWKDARRPYLIAHYIFATVFIIPPFLMIPDQDMAFREIQQKLPCYLDSTVENRHIFIFALDSTIPTLCIGLFLVTLTIEILAFFGILFVKMALRDRESSAVSAKTHELQKKFAIALSLQTGLPFAVLAVPVAIMIALVNLNSYNQSVSNLLILVVSTHGILSALIMMFVHKPYRDVVTAPFQLVVQRNRVSTSDSGFHFKI